MRMRAMHPAPTQHRKNQTDSASTAAAPQRLRWIRRTALLGVLTLLAGSAAWMVPSATARLGDGRVELTWRNVGSLRTGLSALTPATPKRRDTPIDPGSLVWVLHAPYGERRVSAIPGGPAGDPSTVDDGTFRVRFDEIEAGAVRLELHHETVDPETAAGSIEVVASWEFFVRAELTTRVVVDLNRGGGLSVDDVHPDPFGNWESWNQSELRILPGLGEAAVDAMDTSRDPRQASFLDGWMVHRPTRLRTNSVGLDRGLTGAQTPLGTVSAAIGSTGRWIITRPAPGQALSLGGSFDTGIRSTGSAFGNWSAQSELMGTTDVSGVLTFQVADDSGPSSLSRDKLEHNGLDAVETSILATLEPFRRGKLRLSFYAQGDQRDYYEHLFAQNLDHAAREDEAYLLAGAVYDVATGPSTLSFDVHYSRSFLETGDARNFDVFENYARLDGLPEVTADGYYWAGDDPATSVDDGHMRDYYLRNLATDWTFRLDSHHRYGFTHPLRAGIEFHRSTYRAYEHLAPSAAALGASSGFQLASYLGYEMDGASQGAPEGHEEKTPERLAVYASQRASLGGLAIELGARLETFDSGQRPVVNRSDPLGSDEQLGLDDLGSEPSVSMFQPRLGLYAPLGDRTHVWLDGGRSDALPPYEALYFDEEFYERQAGVAATSQVRAASAFVFGNPDLQPETRWSAQAGIVRKLGANASLRISGTLATVTDTWVAVRESAGFDSLSYYDNAGERRERNLHLGLTWATGARSRVRASYDLGQVETNVVEPTSLLRGLRYPHLALENAALPQTAVSDPTGIHDGVERDFYPSLLDRRHQVAVSWLTQFGSPRTGTFGDRRGGSFILTFRAASGLPFTKTFVRQEGDALVASSAPRAVDPANLNADRMPGTWQIDLAADQPFTFWSRQFVAWAEARNITDKKNVVRVYNATGDAEDDGWLESSAGQAAILSGGPGFANEYRDRLDDPTRFDEGLAIRAGISILF